MYFQILTFWTGESFLLEAIHPLFFRIVRFLFFHNKHVIAIIRFSALLIISFIYNIHLCYLADKIQLYRSADLFYSILVSPIVSNC